MTKNSAEPLIPHREINGLDKVKEIMGEDYSIEHEDEIQAIARIYQRQGRRMKVCCREVKAVKVGQRRFVFSYTDAGPIKEESGRQ